MANGHSRDPILNLHIIQIHGKTLSRSRKTFRIFRGTLQSILHAGTCDNCGRGSKPTRHHRQGIGTADPECHTYV